MFGSRHSCLEFQFHVGVRTLALHVLSRFGSMWGLEFTQPHALLSTCVVICVVACSFVVFYRLHVFMLCLVLCGTQFVFFMGCVLSCCHVLCKHVAYEYSH